MTRRFTKYPSNYIRCANNSELALLQSNLPADPRFDSQSDSQFDFWYFLGDCIDGVFDAVERQKHIVNKDLDERTQDIIIQCADGTYYRLPRQEYLEVFQCAYDAYGDDYDQCVAALLGVVMPWSPNDYRLGSGKYRLGSGGAV